MPVAFANAVLEHPLLKREEQRFAQGFHTFKPRPDQPERYDQQAAFVNSKTKGVAWLIGGNGAGTTHAACYKIAKFVMDTPPPRRDTPFWIISDSFEQVIQTAWAEKLDGARLMPYGEVDWNRVRWWRPHQNLPASVALKPWPGRPGKNWTLVFKSYEQGRQKLQAQSIGGFCFIEQFPWPIFEEVVRGCREYNYPGSKFCEFTPIDPNLSIKLEEMLDNGHAPKDPAKRERGLHYLPDDWEIFRANTQCAVEAGHVDERWFNEFFGMVSEEMRETRMIGAWATYEGAIYQGFNPYVHLLEDEQIFPDGDFPPNVFHYRGIDFGSGPTNPFACVWGYRNGVGQWFIYDEYLSSEEVPPAKHFRNIQDAWAWPQKHPNYRSTYADPSGLAWIRTAGKMDEYCPGYESMSMARGTNTVLDGIWHIQWLLEPMIPMDEGELQPRLFIHKDRCPNLIREMRTYRWERPARRSVNPKDAKRQPLKKDDHLCTISTMPVLTKAGWKRIIDVASGELVASRDGWTEVLCGATKTGIQQQLVRVITNLGQELVCTPDHQFLTREGMLPARLLMGKCLVQFCPGLHETGHVANLSSMAESCGGDTSTRNSQMPDIFKSVSVQRARRSTCIDECMRITSAPSQKECTSITEKVSGITDPQALSCCRTPSTDGITPTSLSRCSSKLSFGAKIIDERRRLSPKKRATHIGTSPKLLCCSAQYAESDSNQKTCALTENDIVALDAAPLAEKHFPFNVPLAASHFTWPTIASESIAAASVHRVIAILPAGKDDTYCIATRSGTMVWDGGLLVSNCDALRYMIYTEASLNGSTPDSMRKERTISRGNFHGVKVMHRNGNGHRNDRNGGNGNGRR